jgi:hypothetical protein
MGDSLITDKKREVIMATRKRRLYKVTIEQKIKLPFRDKPEAIGKVLSVVATSRVSAIRAVKRSYSGVVVSVEAGKLV